MRHFSMRPVLALRGRTFHGLRGFAGKPFHPPLTDIPVAAYLFTAVFDVLSLVLRASHPVAASELRDAASWVLLGGAAVSLLTALTGWADWAQSSEPGTQARRTINTHAVLMIAVTALVLADLAWRFADPAPASSPGLAALSVLSGLVVAVGATFGGALVFEHGFNVETAGDSPAWHRSERDVMPGEGQ